MNQLAEKKVGKIVADNFRTAKVFTEFGIDFCCKGGVKLSEACETRGLDTEKVIQELLPIFQTADSTNYLGMGMKELVDHIVTVHHKYVEDTIPALKFYLDKINRVHGDRHPELEEIKTLFFETADALTVHMKKEEFVLFPYIKAMEDALKNDFPLSAPHFGHIDNPIAMMEEEHDTEGERFRKISALSNTYNPPSDACQTYRVAFAMLQEFENDLHTHIHLENNILFPVAQQVFAQLNS
ncbi:iron-sulfur cluster repair di-iron protein [Algoriphagus sp. H41]|uniref:Iron-sulfur cluster repair di-iron protein n=1 Tax=Algoriphagus oliviformis TaxID=2811231 RepID=A0ABS3C8V0_9BACT|nr:iron-sulfur cluster repair di-iron protein [Algoriphagus oliviformis]MBN7813522.1 iron-sulfur cluster repair di-iron protein [Algoriphagus oliviformis]